MLDQNTDRMWMVIGAIVVGAAIIGVVSVAFPDLMDSIITSFEEMLGTYVAPTTAINPFGKLF